MKIQLVSDLHLESHPHFRLEPAADADLLVLAGDIGSYQQGSLLASHGVDDFGLARFSPLPVAAGGAGWPVPVVFVPGNHEYDGLDFDDAGRRLQQACERLDIIWLEQKSVVMGNVRLVGCDLWTDFDALTDAPGLAAQATPPQRLKAREKAFRAANFYLTRNHSFRAGVPMLADAVRELGLQSRDWLRRALLEPFSGSTVAITHFAPSLLSADPRYGVTPGTAGFCNSLDALLPLASVWMHGHLHCAVDYWSRGCRVVANPLGYAQKGEQAAFRPQFCVSV